MKRGKSSSLPLCGVPDIRRRRWHTWLNRWPKTAGGNRSGPGAVRGDRQLSGGTRDDAERRDDHRYKHRGGTCGEEAGSGDAPDEEEEAVALRDETAYRGG